MALPAPQDPDLAIVLLMLRRMACGNSHEQDITALGYQAFGREYERPLTLIRTYLIETATAAERRIGIVCGESARMSEDEGAMLDALTLVTRDNAAAENCLRQVCDTQDVSAPLAAATLLARALIDLGCPLIHTPRG